MAIYTRTGDKGETGLLGGVRTNKGSNQIMVIGAVDELNSHLGLSVAMLETMRMSATGENVQQIEIGLAVTQGQLQDVQRRLFEIGAELAKSGQLTNDNLPAQAGLQLTEEQRNKEIKKLEAEALEQWIDEMDKDLPELKNFILPGGGVVGAELMVTRAVCRRAERELVRYLNARIQRTGDRRPDYTKVTTGKQDGSKWNESLDEGDKEILAYLNRLGDYLFVAGRWVNWILKEEEVIWKI